MVKLFNYIKNYFISEHVNKFCPVCQSKVEKFMPLSEQFRGKVVIENKEYLPYLEAEMLNANEYSCPKCGASDRERFYALYLKNYLFKRYKTENIKMVHFAPEASLRNFLNIFTFSEYRTADLMMDKVDDKADLTNLHMYKDNYFDFFICSHMLEHIIDDISAMKELYRILKPNAKGILVVPILEGLNEIHEDVAITTEVERLLNFGQADHVRMYNKNGYLKRLTNVGFKVHEIGYKEFSKNIFEQSGITEKSILYIVEKVN